MPRAIVEGFTAAHAKLAHAGVPEATFWEFVTGVLDEDEVALPAEGSPVLWNALAECARILGPDHVARLRG